MDVDTLPIGTRVFIDPASEHFPGEDVYIIDVAEDDEYTYCVSRVKRSPAAGACEWVRTEHVHSPRAVGRPLMEGDKVVVEDRENQTVKRMVGFVAKVFDRERIAVSALPGGAEVWWVRRAFVHHAD